jgi:paraquat-inducible protein B
MSESPHDSEAHAAVPAPTIRKRAGPSLVWIIPLVTALVGSWLIYKTLSEKGPQITVTFKTAEGIEVGKTKIKYKNIDVGVVEALDFTRDFSHVILTATMAKESEPFLRRDTRFWVVKPRLSLRGVSGLGTLLSGAYIELEPGEGGVRQSHFVGLETPPVVKAEEAGKRIVLLAERLGSVDTGSPIYYQGILAGEVLGYELGNDQTSVFVHAFIKAPYDELVRGNTRFWNVSGLDVSIGADGVNVRTESMASLLFGGIAFFTPETMERVKEDIEGLVFTLYDDRETIADQSYTKKLQFVLFFDGSVRGLSVGAPVEFKGIKVGSVTDIRLEFNNRDASFRIPVLVEIEPERVIATGDDETATPQQTLELLVQRGLRARLQTGSLLTGKLFVELDMHPDTEINLVNAGGPFPELPTIPASLEEITTSIRRFLTKLDKVNIDKIGTELEGTLRGTNKFVNAPELTESIDDLRRALGTLRSILDKVDTRVEPLAVTVEEAAAAGRDALIRVQTTLGLMDEVLKPDSPLQYETINMAQELAEAARSIRIFVDLLERKPNSLIFGKKPQGAQ